MLFRNALLAAFIFVAIAVALVAASSGKAQTLAYFNGPGGSGFDNEALDPPLAADYEVSSSSILPDVGIPGLDGGDLDIRLRVRTRLVEKDGFFRAKVRWVLRNRSGVSLDNVLVYFDSLRGGPEFPDYSARSIELATRNGGDPFNIIRATMGEQPLYYSGWAIRDFAPGRRGRVVRRFRLDISGSPVDGRSPGLVAASALAPMAVPESSAAIFLAMSLGGVGVVSRSTRLPGRAG